MRNDPEKNIQLVFPKAWVHSISHFLLWMGEILHHFETRVETITLVGMYKGIEYTSRLSEWCCDMDFATHSDYLSPEKKKKTKKNRQNTHNKKEPRDPFRVASSAGQAPAACCRPSAQCRPSLPSSVGVSFPRDPPGLGLQTQLLGLQRSVKDRVSYHCFRSFLLEPPQVANFINGHHR